MRLQYTLGILYSILHLGIGILHNLQGLALTHGADQPSACQLWLEHCCAQRWIGTIANLSGLQGSYGFYSPSVGSSYHSVFVLTDRTTGAEIRLSDPGLRSGASKIRYRSLLEVSGGWVSADPITESDMIQPLARALGISICQQLAVLYADMQINCSYTAYLPPILHAAQGEEQSARYILLYQTQANYDTTHEETDTAEPTGTIPTPHGDRLPAGTGDDEDMG